MLVYNLLAEKEELFVLLIESPLFFIKIANSLFCIGLSVTLNIIFPVKYQFFPRQEEFTL